jgi:myo-inositol-1(or 4)-monophosphatase
MPDTRFDLQMPDQAIALRALIEQAARIGGDLAQARYGRVRDVRLKNDRSEVSEADEAAQAAIVAFLAERRPEDAIIAEESTSSGPVPPADDRYCWVIDPIDGTRSYLRQAGNWCTSIGLMVEGYPIAGAIFAPADGCMFAAVRGGGLYVNGKPWDPASGSVSKAHKYVVGIPSTTTGDVHALAHNWLDKWIVRNLGTTALHMAYVATGQFDAALSANSKLWDIAAGACLIEAAGGRLTAPRGTELFPLDVSRYEREEIPTLAASAAAYDDLVLPAD